MNVMEEMKKEGKKELICNMLKKGMDIALISEISGFSKEEITKIQKEMGHEKKKKSK